MPYKLTKLSFLTTVSHGSNPFSFSSGDARRGDNKAGSVSLFSHLVSFCYRAAKKTEWWPPRPTTAGAGEIRMALHVAQGNPIQLALNTLCCGRVLVAVLKNVSVNFTLGFDLETLSSIYVPTNAWVVSITPEADLFFPEFHATFCHCACSPFFSLGQS